MGGCENKDISCWTLGLTTHLFLVHLHLGFSEKYCLIFHYYKNLEGRNWDASILLITEFTPPHGTLVCCAPSCLTVCDPMDCSPPGSSVHGIFQARVLEWVAISYSRGSSRLRVEPSFLASPVI